MRTILDAIRQLRETADAFSERATQAQEQGSPELAEAYRAEAAVCRKAVVYLEAQHRQDYPKSAPKGRRAPEPPSV